jgi:quercetin dioxygenase-like cupin family protein
MTTANWKTQVFGKIMSLLYNNPHRVVEYRIRDTEGNWVDRASTPAPVLRLFETEATEERTCLQTIQFVHHVFIPPAGRHVEELHIHPDAEELVVITAGRGVIDLGGTTQAVSTGDVIYIPPAIEHELRNDNDEELLGALFINVPTGEGLQNLAAAQQQAR